MPRKPTSPETCRPCAFSANTHPRRLLVPADSLAMRAPIFDEGPEEKANKKEGRRKSGHPSPVSLSEEGSLVCCIGVPAGNRSTFLKENCRRKSEERSGAHIPKGLLRGAVAPNLALSYCSPASPRGFRIRRKNAIVEVQANNLSAHQMHGVKL